MMVFLLNAKPELQWQILNENISGNSPSVHYIYKFKIFQKLGNFPK
jgi:hypothetical protein